MDNPNHTGSPLGMAAGAAGRRATEAFKLLGNETRLAILLALWERYEPFTDDNAVPFSDLRERVGVRDKGQFHYHLRQLDGRFIEDTDGGYELRNAGKKLVQVVIAGTGIEPATLDRTEIDRKCPYCGSPTVVAYENERLFQTCTGCEGAFAAVGDPPRGTLSVWPFPPAGLSDRTPAEVFAAGAVYTILRWTTTISGICPECTGTVETWFHVCEDHDPASDRVCSTCRRQYEVEARFVCTVCKNRMWGPPSMVVALDPTVMASYEDRGIEVGYDIEDFASINRILDLISDHDHELVERDPPRVRVTFSDEDGDLHVTIDEEMTVVDVTGSR